MTKYKDENGDEKDEHPWDFGGRSDFDKKLLEEKHFNTYREKQAFMDRLVASGKINEAVQFAKAWGSQWNKYYNPDNPFVNLDEKYLDAGSNFFNWRTLEGYLRQGKDGAKAREFENDPGRFIRAVLPGGGNLVLMGDKSVPVENLKDAWEKFIYFEEKAFRLGRGEAGYGAIADSDWANEREKQFTIFNKAVRTILQEGEHKEILQMFDKLRDYDTYNDKKSPFFIKEAGNEEQRIKRNQFIQDNVSLVMDLFWTSSLDPVEWERKIKEFILGDVSSGMTWNKTPDERGDKIKKLALWDKEVVTEGKGKNLVFSKTRNESAELFSSEPGVDEYVWRHDNFKNDALGVRDAELGLAEELLGVPRNKIKQGWMLSEDKEKDPIAKGTFTVDEGDKKGTYRVGYDEKGNYYLLKKNDDSWEKTGEKIERPLTASEEQNLYIKTMEDYRKQIRNGVNPLTGRKDFDFSGPPPGSGITNAQWNDPLYRVQKDTVWANYFMRQTREGD